MTLVTMKQADFETLSDERLGWACVESTLVSIRGKNVVIKEQVISSLNRSQQALCMFRVFYDHAKDSASEYYSWISYLLEAPGYWTGVTASLRYFGDENLLQLLEDTKQSIEERSQKLDVPIANATYKDLEQDRELSHAINRLYERFHEIIPDSLKRIGTFIRSNQQDFVIIESEVS